MYGSGTRQCALRYSVRVSVTSRPHGSPGVQTVQKRHKMAYSASAQRYAVTVRPAYAVAVLQ